MVLELEESQRKTLQDVLLMIDRKYYYQHGYLYPSSNCFKSTSPAGPFKSIEIVVTIPL